MPATAREKDLNADKTGGRRHLWVVLGFLQKAELPSPKALAYRGRYQHGPQTKYPTALQNVKGQAATCLLDGSYRDRGSTQSQAEHDQPNRWLDHFLVYVREKKR